MQTTSLASSNHDPRSGLTKMHSVQLLCTLWFGSNIRLFRAWNDLREIARRCDKNCRLRFRRKNFSKPKFYIWKCAVDRAESARFTFVSRRVNIFIVFRNVVEVLTQFKWSNGWHTLLERIWKSPRQRLHWLACQIQIVRTYITPSYVSKWRTYNINSNEIYWIWLITRQSVRFKAHSFASFLIVFSK